MHRCEVYLYADAGLIYFGKVTLSELELFLFLSFYEMVFFIFNYLQHTLSHLKTTQNPGQSEP